MSKKILKRSLALGALMAFVITGSAMAKNTVKDPVVAPLLTEKTVYDTGMHKRSTGGSSETWYSKWSLGSNELVFSNNTTAGFGNAFSMMGYIIDGEAGSKLTIITNGTEKENYGIWGYGEIDVDELSINSVGSAIFASDQKGDTNYNYSGEADKYCVTDITANKIHITSKDNAINMRNADGVQTINIHVGNELVVEAEGTGISFNGSGGKVNISKKENEYKTLVDITAGGSVISTRQDDTIVKIDAYDIVLKSAGTDEPDKGHKGHIVYANLNNNEVTIAAENNLTMTAYTDKDIIFAASNANVSVSAEGISTLIGDIEAKDTSEVTVTLNGTASTFTGNVTKDDSATVNLTLNSATWNVTGDSTVTKLDASDSNIKLGINADGSIATVDIVNGAESNLADLTVSGNGDVADAIAAGKVNINELASAVEGAEVTSITTDEGLVAGAMSATVDAQGNVGPVVQAVNQKAEKVSKAGTNLKTHYRAHMNDMNKRMGELRMANGEAGVWTRMVRGENEYQGAKAQYNQYQLGYDEKLSVDKRWTVGAAVTFAEGDGSYGQGSTEDKSTAFAIYGSKLNNDGTFVDLIARYAHLESDLEDSVYGKGDYSTNGMSVSAEFGKRIQQGNGLWIEPQVEFTYGTVDSANFAFDRADVHFDSMDSFIARAGFAMGKDIKQGNVYARASYLYDFDGETTTIIGSGTTPIEEDFGGGWWEVGVGANINLSKATYIYADIEKTFGGEVDTNWQWNLGVRYSF